MKRFAPLFCALLLAVPASAQEVLDSWRVARTALEDCVKATGGAPLLRSRRQLSMSFKGKEWNVGQAATPVPAYDVIPVEGKIAIDTEKGRAVLDSSASYMGNYSFSQRTVVDGDRGFSLNLNGKTSTPVADAPMLFRAITRSRPNLLLVTALERSSTLRYLGESSLDDERLIGVTFADIDGSQNALYFDADSHMLRKTSSLATDPVRGDVVVETVYPEYRKIDGVMMPLRLLRYENGELVRDIRFDTIRFSMPNQESDFHAPAGFLQPASSKAAPRCSSGLTAA